MPTGTATLAWDPSSKLISAQINMFGFTPSSSHAMHIHPGTCADQSQPPSVPFQDITADSGGAVSQKVESAQPAPNGIPTGSYLNIHLAPMASLGEPADLSFTPIACADIPAGTSSTGPVTLTMKPPTMQGLTPKATVHLAYNTTAHTLNVALQASGLQPNSAHAVHIHKGSCRAQGDIVHPLPDLQADSSGNASLNQTINNVTTQPPAAGWYINVHMGPMDSIVSGDKPTLLFAPILCADIRQ
jgi:Cu/Zn superoxide dismutase